METKRTTKDAWNELRDSLEKFEEMQTRLTPTAEILQQQTKIQQLTRELEQGA